MENIKAPLENLASFVAGLDWETLPKEVQQAAVYRVLDLVTVSVGASGNALVEQMKQACKAMDPEPRTKGAALWGEPEGGLWAPETAAMLNAMLAHTLELDDVHPSSKLHASASLIPAAWSLAQVLGTTGKQLLTAVVAGYETAFRIGMAFDVAAHRAQGWHVTATAGVFGAAAACGYLLGLDAQHMTWALGLAGSQSAGVWAFLADGTNSKVLNPAHAASAGMRAAFLAKYGMVGPKHILEAKDGGLLNAMSNGGHIEKVDAELGTSWEILHMDMKPYPCCRSAHGTVDALLRLRKEVTGGKDLTPAQIEALVDHIDVGIYKIGYQQCAVSDGCLHPQNPMDAKFSLPYTGACALLYGTVDDSSFTPDKVADSLLQSLLAKVHAVEDPELTAQYPAHWSCKVDLVLKDGTHLETFVQDPSGSYRQPLSLETAQNKAIGLLAHVYGNQARAKALELLELAGKDVLPEI